MVLVSPTAECDTIVMYSTVTSHQQPVVLQQGVHVVEHGAVHLWKEHGNLQEPDVHHRRSVEDCWIVLHKSQVSS